MKRDKTVFLPMNASLNHSLLILQQFKIIWCDVVTCYFARLFMLDFLLLNPLNVSSKLYLQAKYF